VDRLVGLIREESSALHRRKKLVFINERRVGSFKLIWSALSKGGSAALKGVDYYGTDKFS
jgi:hypothetical protein